MTEQRFACTACGLCCSGSLPLTIDEALYHAEAFPIAMALTPIKHTDKAFAAGEKLGLVIQPARSLRMAVMASPIAYLPQDKACPYLVDALCSIHETKPLRCRAMPFNPCRDEGDQAPHLIPRKGWKCDTGPEAPVVYRGKVILDKAAFNAERQALLDQRKEISTYLGLLLQHNVGLTALLVRSVQRPVPERVIIGLLPFLQNRSKEVIAGFAQKQCSVLEKAAALPASEPFPGNYSKLAHEARKFATLA